MSLYDRQETLEIDSSMSITIVGCGGIGYWFAKFAAMSGIREIHLFDADVIEEHNLNRLDIPIKAIGKNKAEITKFVIETLRGDCSVYANPFKFNEYMWPDTDWFIDCTDKIKAQYEHESFCKGRNDIRYMKCGYDGLSISITEKIATWAVDESDFEDNGYTITPSWVVPAVIVASLGVGKLMKFKNEIMGTTIDRLYLK